VGTPQDVQGLNAAVQYTSQFIGQLAQDKNQKQLVKQMGDALGEIENQIKAFQQRQEAAAKKAQQQNGGGLDPKDAAKIQGTIITAQTKAKLASESHAQRTAQRQLQFEQKIRQDEQKHAQDLVQQQQDIALDQQKKRVNLFEE
jgi:hypothetical protein